MQKKDQIGRRQSLIDKFIRNRPYRIINVKPCRKCGCEKSFLVEEKDEYCYQCLIPSISPIMIKEGGCLIWFIPIVSGIIYLLT